ncbi:PREDICTED: ataxin-3-like isoform X2 [Polistes dominula]|nr:PREDICTED: ataxin-3-like isoform X2 [Polistes dominula]
MDDSGYFSVQVISSALKGVWGLELIPYNSTEPVALSAQNDPSQMKAYICNYKGHWLTIRKIGTQWFNLNSMLNGPELISDTYLAMYLAQLLQGGYSIFIVIGNLPQCPADEILMKNPIKMPCSIPRTKESVKEEKPMTTGYRLGTKEEDDVMKAVRALEGIKVPSSYNTPKFVNSSSDYKKDNLPKQEISNEKPRERIIPIRIEGKEDLDEENDEELQKALRLSLQDNEDDTDKNVNLRFESHADNKISPSTELDDIDQDDELRKAVQLSLECVTAPPTPDLEDLRWRRLSHFGVYSKTSNNETSPKLNS